MAAARPADERSPTATNATSATTLSVVERVLDDAAGPEAAHLDERERDDDGDRDERADETMTTSGPERATRERRRVAGAGHEPIEIVGDADGARGDRAAEAGDERRPAGEKRREAAEASRR